MAEAHLEELADAARVVVIDHEGDCSHWRRVPAGDALARAGLVEPVRRELVARGLAITGTNLDTASKVLIEDAVVAGQPPQTQIHDFPCAFTIISATRLDAVIPQASIASGRAVTLIVANSTGATTARNSFDFAHPTTIPTVSSTCR